MVRELKRLPLSPVIIAELERAIQRTIAKQPGGGGKSGR